MDQRLTFVVGIGTRRVSPLAEFVFGRTFLRPKHPENDCSRPGKCREPATHSPYRPEGRHGYDGEGVA